MQTILFVPELINQQQIDRISSFLDETRVSYKIVLESHAVVIDGSNDLVYAAKTAIQEAGFSVK